MRSRLHWPICMMSGPLTMGAVLSLLLFHGCSAPMRGPQRTPAELPSGETARPGYSEIEGQARPDPFGHLDLWPNQAQSSLYPLTVRYQSTDQQQQARELVRHLEVAYRAHVELMGFRPPFPYSPDGSGNFTGFIWRGYGRTLALPGARVEGIDWEAHRTFLIADPWGEGGGAAFPDTVAHEFHLAVIRGYDPWETPAFQVASATYAQDVVDDESNAYLAISSDFQSHATRALGYYDGFQSWYSYGSCLYLFFLAEGYFSGDPRFISRIWENSQGNRLEGSIYAAPVGQDGNPTWVAALQELLPEGVSFNSTLVDFARWRYYTGERDDGAHLSEAVLFSRDLDVTRREVDVDDAPMVQSYMMATGTEYFRLRRSPSGNAHPSIVFEGDPDVHWSLQVVPDPDGRSDGQTITGTRLNFGDLLELTLIITALPRELYDPTIATDQTYTYRFTLGRR